ncbi:TraG-like protein, N-terminal region [Klebsiella variicola]|nr:TraG-like protein, N-terminal region [Klebsiella variicola]
MTADSYLEMVLVFMGWLINNALWMIITTTGIFAIPLAFKIAGVWLKVREEGMMKGIRGRWRCREWSTFCMSRLW